MHTAVARALEGAPRPHDRANVCVVLLRRRPACWVVARCRHAPVARARARRAAALLEVAIKALHQLRDNCCVGGSDIVVLPRILHHLLQEIID